MLKIKKIKITDKGQKVKVEYFSKNSAGFWDENTMHSAEVPEPELLTALENLGADVIDICELPDSDEGKIQVTGVAFSYSGDNQDMGASIIARKSLSKSSSPLNIVTPHKMDSGEVDELQQLERSTVVGLESLISYAIRFIGGKRAQQSLFDVKVTQKGVQV